MIKSTLALVMVCFILTGNSFAECERFLFEDKTQKFGISEIEEVDTWDDFNGVLSRGHSDSVFWIKFICNNSNDVPAALSLDLGFTMVRSIKIFDDGYSESIGIRDIKPPEIRVPVYLFSVKGASKKTIYARLSSAGPILAKLTVKDVKSHVIKKQGQDIFYGFFLGMMFLITLLSFWIFCNVGINYNKSLRRTYLIYFLFELSNFFYQVSYSGVGNIFIWSSSVFLRNRCVTILSPILLFFLMEYSKLFLGATSRIARVFSCIQIANVLCLFVCIFCDQVFAVKLVSLCALIECTFVSVYGIIQAFKKKNTSDNLFAIGITTYLFGLTILLLRNFGLISFNLFTLHAQEISSLLEMIIFLVAVFLRLREERLNYIHVESAKATSRTMIHELKRPLVNIQTEFKIHPEYKKNEVIKESLDCIKMIGKKFSALNKLNIKKTRVDLPNLLRESFDVINGKGSLDFQVECNSPFIECDRDLFKQVFINLFENAKEANSQTSISVIVENISSKKYTKSSCFKRIVVKNTGSTIDKNVLKKIFISFVSTKHNGSGIGLNMVNNVIELHGGTTSIESKNNNTFVIMEIPIPTTSTSKETSWLKTSIQRF